MSKEAKRRVWFVEEIRDVVMGAALAFDLEHSDDALKMLLSLSVSLGLLSLQDVTTVTTVPRPERFDSLRQIVQGPS